MGKHQDDAYREAIEEYRTVSRARSADSSEIRTNVFGVLQRRQISNYFVQFRKVRAQDSFLVKLPLNAVL